MSRFIPAALIALMATAAFAGPQDKVKEIEVLIDLPAITNPAAALRYSTVAADLQSAIAARLVDRISPDEGVKIGIDISEVELSNSFTEAVGSADTKLVANVNITDEKDNSNFRSYELTVNVDQAKALLPATDDLTQLSASSDDFYQAMIAAFADGTVALVNK
jgi:hypothetical protein